MGLWLPLALAELTATIQNALKGKDEQPRKLSSVLSGWCLPSISKAVEAEEERANQMEMRRNFEALAARFGGAKNGD